MLCTSIPEVSKPPLHAGMAGSGKTTLIQRINSHMHQHKLPGYIINLDPAVTHLPYGANIDIRDTVSNRLLRSYLGSRDAAGCIWHVVIVLYGVL